MLPLGFHTQSKDWNGEGLRDCQENPVWEVLRIGRLSLTSLGLGRFSGLDMKKPSAGEGWRTRMLVVLRTTTSHSRGDHLTRAGRLVRGASTLILMMSCF